MKSHAQTSSDKIITQLCSNLPEEPIKTKQSEKFKIVRRPEAFPNEW